MMMEKILMQPKQVRFGKVVKFIPVSYTHLDVYKRQIPSGPCSCVDRDVMLQCPSSMGKQ